VAHRSQEQTLWSKRDRKEEMREESKVVKLDWIGNKGWVENSSAVYSENFQEKDSTDIKWNVYCYFRIK